LFDYSSDAPIKKQAAKDQPDASHTDRLSTAASRAAAASSLPDIVTLEGASEEPTMTKVVDRRWYERNKHIYPASTWQEFDPEKDYASEIRKDMGGNTYFFSK
jgi:protein FAM50